MRRKQLMRRAAPRRGRRPRSAAPPAARPDARTARGRRRAAAGPGGHRQPARLAGAGRATGSPCTPAAPGRPGGAAAIWSAATAPGPPSASCSASGFPGRTAVERHAVAALRAELPWPGEAVLHRQPPWRTGGDEVTARPLPGRGVAARLAAAGPRRTGHPRRAGDADPGHPGRLVRRDSRRTNCSTPASTRCTTGSPGAGAWAGPSSPGTPPTCWARSAPRALDEGLRDADNLAWKLAESWHHGASDHAARQLPGGAAHRRRRAAARRRPVAADTARRQRDCGRYLPGDTRAHGHPARRRPSRARAAGRGRPPIRTPPSRRSTPSRGPMSATAPGGPVADVRVTAPDGATARLRDRLGQGRLLVVLVAPGTGVWDRRHWLTAGVMPRLAAAVTRAAGTGRTAGHRGLSGRVRRTVCCWCGRTGTSSPPSPECARPTCTRRRTPRAGGLLPLPQAPFPPTGPRTSIDPAWAVMVYSGT